MLTPPFPHNETERLNALFETGLLDSLPEERFDRLTRIAQRLFKVPYAMVSLVDSKRQWFKSKQGLDTCETSRDISFCGHAILEENLFEVQDASKDPRFADNPLVLGVPFVRFYAGVPIHTPDRFAIGTLCIVDDRPRQLSEDDKRALYDLADCINDEIAWHLEKINQQQ